MIEHHRPLFAARRLVAGFVVVAALAACYSNSGQSATDSSSTGSGPSAVTDTTASMTGTTGPTATDSSGTAVAPSTTQPAPAAPQTPGNVNETVAEGTVTSLPPVPVQSSATITPQVVADVPGVEIVQAEARQLGEVSGRAVKITVRLTNGLDSELSAGGVTVTATAAGDTELSPVASNSTPFSGAVAAHASGTGAYVFSFPDGVSGPLTITVTAAASMPVAVFTANV
jgi:hypothetical protein